MRFVKAVNKGIKLADGEYVCLLNCDTEVKRNFVERNVEILDADASIAGLSCIIVDKYGKNWWTGGGFNKAYPVNLTDDFEGIRSVDFVAGTAAFYRREVFDKIGLFDESYRMYHEDVEFGLRIKAQTDYRTCAFSDKLVVHYQVNSIPGPEVRYLLDRNQIFIVRRYFPRLLPRVILNYLTDIIGTLTKDLLGLHPWVFYFHLLSLRHTFRGIFAGLSQKPSGGPRLVED
jgi:GT2 family glycosyltransferase